MFLDISRFKFPVEHYFILSRASSGILNGSFYGNLYEIGIIGFILTLVFTIFSVKFVSKKRRILFWISFVLTLISIFFVVISFVNPTFAFADVHLWTLLTQSFQTLCYVLNNPKNWWKVLLLVAPSVFLQKLFINLLGGNPWYYQGTDVKSGKYYKIFGVKVYRTFSGNMYFRLIMSLISLTILYWYEKRNT